MSSSGRPQDVWKSSAATRPPGGATGRTRGGAGRWFAAALVVVALGGAIAGLLVYLRAGNFKGTEQPFLLHERHVYYDAQSRYTVRFGPLFDTDPNREVTLDLYAVASLKEASAKAGRSVTVRPPAGRLESFGMPQELEVLPR